MYYTNRNSWPSVQLRPLLLNPRLYSYTTACCYTQSVHYRLYTKDGPITSNNPIYANNPFIGRTLPKHITPPRTALSLKKHLCKIEGLPSATSFELFESLSSHTAVLDSSRLALREYSGFGLSEDDPVVLVVGLEDATKRPASTARLEGLPKAVPAQPRYGMH